MVLKDLEQIARTHGITFDMQAAAGFVEHHAEVNLAVKYQYGQLAYIGLCHGNEVCMLYDSRPIATPNSQGMNQHSIHSLNYGGSGYQECLD